MFNPKRLITARQRRGLTQTRLAGLCGMTPQTVARHERGQNEPTPETVERIAEVLGFDKNYFELDDPPVVGKERPSFRALQSMTAAVRDRALGAASQAIELERSMSESFNLPTPNVPDLSHLEPEQAALALREHWGIGVRPIPNMVHLLEKHGVRVFSIDEESTALRAFCLWEDDLPIVLLSLFGTAEMSRFNAAHELAHLALHRNTENVGKVAEKQANAFASAFLMPRDSILGACRRRMSFEDVVAQKKRWGVSVSALAYRLHSDSIGLLTDWEHKRINIELSRQGRTIEPDPIDGRETSWILGLAQQELRKDKKSLHALVPHLPPFDVHALCFRAGVALVWNPPDGGDRVSQR